VAVVALLAVVVAVVLVDTVILLSVKQQVVAEVLRFVPQ
jgi:hypothetical protein